MESNSGRPDPAEARAALADIATIQRAVRDTPWPTWLYLVNALLLGSIALTPTLQEHRNGAVTVLVVAVLGVNMSAGYRMGTPWALPTSRVFLLGVAIAGMCMAGALTVGDLAGWAWLTVPLAVTASVSYLVGSVAHRRSTRRTP